MPFQADPQNAIPAHFQITYQNTWNLVIQQENERMADLGILEPRWTGNQYVATDLGQQDWVDDNVRFGQSDPSEITGGNRSGFKQSFKFQRKFDKWDESFLGALGSPTSEVIMSAKMGLARKKDAIFSAAAVAASVGGTFPHTTSMAFPTGNIIAVDFVPLTITAPAANLYRGLTVGKMLEAKRQLLTAEVPADEELYIAMTPQQQMDLSVYSQGYANDPWAAMVASWIADPTKKLFGMIPRIYNSLPVTAGGIRTCVVFSQRAMCVAPMEMKTYMDRLPTANHALQIAHYGLWGAFRKRDELVRTILCDETPAA